MAHRRAKLTPQGRFLLVERVTARAGGRGRPGVPGHGPQVDRNPASGSTFLQLRNPIGFAPDGEESSLASANLLGKSVLPLQGSP